MLRSPALALLRVRVKGPAGAARRFGSEATAKEAPKKNWWTDASWWGMGGALAGWGMTGAAVYDASAKGPEVISMNMTGVMIVYSSLFCRWAFIVKPQNLLLSACHASNVVAQSNQMRRAIESKLERGEEAAVRALASKAAAVAATMGVLIAVGPKLQAVIVAADLGPVSKLAAADAGKWNKMRFIHAVCLGSFIIGSVFAASYFQGCFNIKFRLRRCCVPRAYDKKRCAQVQPICLLFLAGPFTTHFWAPMSKWLISGASFLELNRPTDQISLAQYSALTLTGIFFSRYGMLVTPVNYTLVSVNVALFGSSAWHLGRKVKADFIDK
jgi:hypothetical protein